MTGMDIRPAAVLRTPSETSETIGARTVERPPPTAHRSTEVNALTTFETVPAAGSPLRPRPSRAPRWRVATLAGATLVLVGGAAIATAASPEPSTAPNPEATAQPDGTTDGGRLFRPLLRGLGLGDGFAGVAGRHGGFAAGNITITAVNGSSVSLETVDGWARTITVTDQTTITRDGEEVALSDLQVGDKIRFRQTVDDAGNYTVTAIAVVLPSVIGQATAVDGDSITLTQPDGSSVTVHVDSSTEFTVGGETGKSLSDVEVGMIVGASGEENADGSLDASRVRAGTVWDGLGRGLGRGHGPGKWQIPDDAAPSAAPENSSSSAS